MKFFKTMKYKIKCLVPALGIAGAAMMPTSCCKAEKAEPNPEPTIVVTIEFTQNNCGEVLTFETLQNYAADKSVRTIYLIPVESWTNATHPNITYLRNNFLQPRLNISKKIRGRGDFNFKLGEASKVPEDSLWYVQNGWTINKKYQR